MATSILFAARLFLGSTFLIAGLGKRTSSTSFVEEIMEYQLLSNGQAQIAAHVLPFVESMAGILCIVGIGFPVTSSLLVFLLLIFTTAVIISLVRGRHFSCHCFGRSSATIGPATIIRNTLLIVLACWISVLSPLTLNANALVTLWQSDIQQIVHSGTVTPIIGVVVLSLAILLLLSEIDTIFVSENGVSI
ncbi:MAG: MauE/DoxX family redox-associated membrane protein [Ktedonobacteraceae bacterium]